MKNFYFDHVDQSYDFQKDGFSWRGGCLFFPKIRLQYPLTQASNPFTLNQKSGSIESFNKDKNLFPHTSFGVDLSFWHQNLLLKSFSMVILLFAYLLYI